MCVPPFFSRKFNRNCTWSSTLFNTDGLIRLHSRRIFALRSSMEATRVAYTFYFKWPNRRTHKESNQVNEVATQLALPFQSNFRASYFPNTFSPEMNNVQAHHPVEKWNRLLSTLNVGKHTELTRFCSSCCSNFDLGRSTEQIAFSFEISHNTIILGLCENVCRPSTWRSVPQILTFCVLTDRLSGKCTHRKKTIFSKYTDIPSCSFWQWRAKITLFLVSVLVIPWRFCILYGYKNKHFRKTRCIVDRGMFSRDSACLILRRGFFPNNDHMFSISPSFIRGLLLSPLCAIFPAA